MTAFLVSCIFFSCKKDEQTVGLGLQPDSDGLNIFQDSVFFSGSILKGDSIRTDELGESFLGNYLDEEFGQSRSTFYGQLELPGNNLDLGLPENLILDSVVLTFRSTQRILGGLEAQSFSVYELDEDLYQDSLYYSDRVALTTSTDIVRIGDDVVGLTNATDITRGDSIFEVIRIPLENSFGQLLLNESGGSVFENNESFQSIFKGLAVQSNTLDAGIIGLDINDDLSGLTLYYRDTTLAETDTTDVTFPFDNSSAYYNYYERDYNSSIFGNPQMEIENNELVYLQGLDGTIAKFDVIDFPEYLIGDSNIVVSSAELIVPIDENLNDKYPIPPGLFISVGNSLDSLKILEDQIFGSSIGGSYDSSRDAYVFNVSLHIQNILKGTAEVEPLWLSVNPPERLTEFLDNAGFFSRLFIDQRRVILNGPNSNSQNPSDNMRLVLTLSE